MNKKSIVIAVVFVLVLIFVSGAIETTNPSVNKGDYLTFTDSEGNIVELSQKPQKVA